MEGEAMTRDEMRELVTNEDRMAADPLAWASECGLALRQLLEETEWKPIETAPKDGTEIFIWREGWHCAPVAKWEYNVDADAYGWTIDEEVYLGQCDEGWLGYVDDDPMPTHWMPLPAPPKGEGDETL
jgi:hypothetical protein